MKDVDPACMKPMLKKPSGICSGHATPVASSIAELAIFKIQDEGDYDTDCATEDESEDVKPTGKLTQSPSIHHFKSVRATTDTICQAVISFSIVKSEEDGRKGKGSSCPGLCDLLPEIGPNVKDTMKPELIKSIATSQTPWDNPSLDVFQQAYDWFFPNYPAMLEIKDPLCSLVCWKHSLSVNH